MEIITIKNSEDEVKIKITLSYDGPSRYIFVASPDHYFDYASSTKPPLEFPHTHVIGRGSILTEPENRGNNWNFELINPSDNELDYELKIEWLQASNLIYTWPVKKEDWKGKVKSHTSSMSFSGNSIYKY